MGCFNSEKKNDIDETALKQTSYFHENNIQELKWVLTHFGY